MRFPSLIRNLSIKTSISPSKVKRKKIESLFVRSEELQETSTKHPKIKKKYCKRKSIDEYEGKGEFETVKKPKFVWRTYFHNLFLHAIKQIG
jgi:hypothetical protein